MKYKDSGVDIDAANEALERIKGYVKSTLNKNVLAGIGSFGALYKFDKSEVLVSSVDSVGTKLKVAFMLDSHDTVGQDLVNHCVNDILCQGAEPLFFMDYIATGVVKPDVVEEIVKGLTIGCKNVSIPLIGGETAELPGFYKEGEYDLTGFIVGRVAQKAIIDGSKIKTGDVIVGFPSSGLHTNGYSLARKIIFEICGLKVSDRVSEFNRRVGEELLQIHRCYLHTVLPLVKRFNLTGIAHITGGGFFDNIKRILPEGKTAEIDVSKWKVPPIFKFLQREGEIEFKEMYRTFNMGIGMVIIVPKNEINSIERYLKRKKEKFYTIGEIKKGRKEVKLVS